VTTQVFSKEQSKEDRSQPFRRGIFGIHSNPETRIIVDHETLLKKVQACRELDQQIVMTSGSFDLTHIGHARYLEVAKTYGDVLIVGVDSDVKVKMRKGDSRPVVPEHERMEMLAHVRPVDIVTIKHPEKERWDLIKRIRPDTLIVTRDTYDKKTLQELTEFCSQVVCLDPQAETSATAKVRLVEIGWGIRIREPIEKILTDANVPERVREEVRRVLMREYEPRQR